MKRHTSDIIDTEDKTRSNTNKNLNKYTSAQTKQARMKNRASKDMNWKKALLGKEEDNKERQDHKRITWDMNENKQDQNKITEDKKEKHEY